MRIYVDESLCSGHGRCYTVAPEVFSADDDGFSLQRGQEFDVASDKEAMARAGAAACPEGAIKII